MKYLLHTNSILITITERLIYELHINSLFIKIDLTFEVLISS